MAISDSLVKEVGQNSILLTSLHAVRTVLEKELEIKNLLITTNEAIKSDLLVRGKTEYPYAYLSLSELTAMRDQGNSRVVQRTGMRVGSFGATRATSRKAYIFPITVGIELKYIDNDPYRLLIMAESMLLLGQISGIAFEVKFSENFKIQVRIEVPTNTTIPLADTSNVQEPSGSEVSLPLIIHTYAGFFREVSAVNSSNPMVDMQIIMSGEVNG